MATGEGALVNKQANGFGTITNEDFAREPGQEGQHVEGQTKYTLI